LGQKILDPQRTPLQRVNWPKKAEGRRQEAGGSYE
jgi:hypothetical protein